MIAARSPTVRPGSVAKVSVPGCRRRDDATVPFPRLGAAERAIAAYADITGENRQLLEAPTASAATAERRSNAVDMAASQTSRWTFAGRRRTRIRSGRWRKTPGVSIPMRASIEAGIGGYSWPGSRCEWSQRAQLVKQSGCVTSRQRTT